MEINYKIIVAVLVTVIAITGFGILSDEFSNSGPEYTDYQTMEIYPLSPTVNQSNGSVVVSVGIYAERSIFEVSNVSVYAMDDRCEELGVFRFGSIDEPEDVSAGASRRTQTLAAVPRYLVVNVPDEWHTSKNQIFVHGVNRTTETPEDGEHGWSEYKIQNPTNRSKWCH